MCAISDLCDDLLSNFSFDFVLLGKFQSDPIEARFGCYQQLSGANFFISVRQLLDSEKKIRVLNKLTDVKKVFDFGEVSLASTFSKDESVASVEYQWLISELHCEMDSIYDIDIHDRNIIFYVAGYIGRSISRQNHCESCKVMLVSNELDDAGV